MTIFFAKKKHPEVLLHMAVSFGPNSGGRTKAVFERSAYLAREWQEQLIITLNHRMEYRTIFEDWGTRHALPKSVKMRNMFEDIAGEELYLPRGVSVRYQLPNGAESTDRQLCWRTTNGHKESHYTLRKNGSLAHIKTYENGNLVQLDRFDRSSTLRTRETRMNDTVLGIDYFLSDGFRFAAVDGILSAPDTQIIVDRGLFSTGGSAISVIELQKRWMAYLCETLHQPIAMIDDRGADQLFIDNPHLKTDVATIAILHSNHLRAPYTDVTAINSFNGPAIEHAERFSAISFLTEHQLADARQVYPCANGWVIPNAVQNPRRTPLRRTPGQRFVLVTRLVSLKRLDHGIRAFAQVVAQFPRAKLEIWGTGDHIAELKALVADLNLEKSVKFKGFTTNPSLAYQGAAGSLIVSKYEGFPFALQEALVHGVPVVAYDFRYGPRAMLRDGWNGYIVENGDIDALADRIIKILGHPVRSRIMGLRARMIMLTLSKRRIARKWSALIQSVNEQRAARG